MRPRSETRALTARQSELPRAVLHGGTGVAKLTRDAVVARPDVRARRLAALAALFPAGAALPGARDWRRHGGLRAVQRRAAAAPAVRQRAGARERGGADRLSQRLRQRHLRAVCAL